MSSELSLKADLHIHSNHSDGRSSVKEILKVAVERRIDVVSITDHDTVGGSLEALEIVREEHLPVIVVPGVEISTAQGHLLAYGITDEIDPGMEMDETARIVRDLGGLTSLAHPFQFYRHGALRLRCFEVVDCVEIFNAKSPRLFNYLSEIFRKKYGKGKTAGSDAHKADFVGYGIITVRIEEVSIEGILKALRDGRGSVDGRCAMFEQLWIRHSRQS